MDDYPAGSLDHNIPLLVVSGLSTSSSKPLLTDPELREQGILVRSELPPVDGREAKSILHYIQEADACNLPWNPQSSLRKYRFKVRTIGREFLLPPRRAPLPAHLESPAPAAVLHSPFSPLSPGSTLYPDGLIDTKWLGKHQDLVPSACLCFYNLSSDPTLTTLHDNQLKTDVNAVKNAIGQSGYRCRLVVVILSDQTPSAVVQFQERLENIRRSTGLDPKTSLFVLPTRRTEAELATAVDSLLSAVFDQASEYYRDLGRHARKKKGRGIAPQPTVPPTSGTSHTLSLQGWNVRYDFKTAVFAEFRQEMDVALRSYELAYETLLGADILETIPAWVPRFNDARLLADIIAIRALRCLLWIGQSSAAVRKWQEHHDRICDLIERRGRGTQSYGWKAWEARWCTIMANLIEKVEFPELESSTPLPYRLPEKNLAADRLQPYEQLHHPGYWYQAAARYLLDRRKLAWSLPEDDRKPPGESEPSPTVGRAYKYDIYMCPEPYQEWPLHGPGVNHAQLIFDHLMLARTEFQKRRQTRASAELVLGACKELERMDDWAQIMTLLTPLWREMSFREERWWDITETLSWTLRGAAVKSGQKDIIVAIDWELLNKAFSQRPAWHYDITKSLDDVANDERPTMSMDDDHLLSFLQTSFAFKDAEGRAGRSCPAQLSITSNAFHDAVPITFEMVRVDFDGSLHQISIYHQKSERHWLDSPSLYVSRVSLVEREVRGDANPDEASETGSQGLASMQLEGSCDLTLCPGQTRVFELDIPLREPGDARASSIQISLAPRSFIFQYTMKVRDVGLPGTWYSTSSTRKSIIRSSPENIKVLPRPPKMEIRANRILEQYYANEPIEIEIELLNEEDADATTKLDITLHGHDVPAYIVQIADGEAKSSTKRGGELSVTALTIGTVPTAGSTKVKMNFDPVNEPTTYSLTTRAWYNLVSDPSTPIIQQTTYRLNIVSPFEASYDLLPRLHPEWPSVFDYEDVQDLSDDAESATSRPRGLAQRWTLTTRYASFANEDLVILDLNIKIVGTEGNVSCITSKAQSLSLEGLTVSPKTIEEAHFDIVAQKFSIDDRSPSAADLAFVIRWRRSGASAEAEANTTILPLPRSFVTISEPRVLARVSYSSPETTAETTESPQLLFLDITIENPSSHFLIFGLVMEPSDEFAFSGAKTTTLNVLPLARRSVTYRLLPLVRGSWIRPTLVVRDKYFQKVLKIIPTEGMKSDKEGVLAWVPPAEEEEEEEEEEDIESEEANK